MILGILGIMIPITALMIPIVAILTGHQRRMAEIMYQNGGPNQAGDPRVLYELQCLRTEVSDLKNQLNQQAIAIDNITPRLPAPQETVGRLG